MEPTPPEWNTVVSLALTVAFGLWAGVVGFGVKRITEQLERIGMDLKEESRKLNQYIVQTEARLAILEDRVVKPK
jgi:hypothetical protein